MDVSQDWLKAGNDFLGAEPEPSPAGQIIHGLCSEVARHRQAAHVPEGAPPVENRSQEWIDAIMAAHRPSQVKAITNAMMRSVTREEADSASLLVAATYAIAAGLKDHPDPSAGVFAITVMVMSRMIKIADEAGERAAQAAQPASVDA
jgi:hypothetical protein